MCARAIAAECRLSSKSIRKSKEFIKIYWKIKGKPEEMLWIPLFLSVSESISYGLTQPPAHTERLGWRCAAQKVGNGSGTRRSWRATTCEDLVWSLCSQRLFSAQRQ